MYDMKNVFAFFRQQRTRVDRPTFFLFWQVSFVKANCTVLRHNCSCIILLLHFLLCLSVLLHAL